MGASLRASRISPAISRSATAGHAPASPAGLVGLAVSRMLRDGAVTGPGQDAGASALPAVLGELADLFGCPAAVAFRQDAGEDPVVLAAHPGDAADQALLAQLSTMATDQGGPPGGDGYAEGAVTFGGRPASARLAYAGQDAGRSPTSVALLGEPARFGLECQATLLAIATIVAAQARHASVTARAGRRARPREARRESENRFRALAQLAPVGIVMADTGGMYTFANVRWCELTGMTMSQALSASWPAGIHPDDVGRLEQEWQRATAMDTELRTDCRLQAGSGSELWAHISMIPVLDGDGQRSGFLGAVTNVSERKRAEAEKERLLNAERAARRSLADQTERLNGLVAAAIPGILMDDEHGRITQLNQSFCDLLGISAAASELIGTSTTRIAIRIQRVFADPGEFLRRARELVANRLPVALDEIACADGRTLEWDFAPVFVDGCYRGNLWGVADATERTALAEQRERLLAAELAAREAAEEAQARLAEQNARLQALDVVKTQFISTMSHELRTPLTSIISFAELILDEKDKLAPDTISSLAVIQRCRCRSWWPRRSARRRRARLSTTSRLMSRSRRARRCARIRCGCSRCSATCCRTRSSTPGRAGRSGSRPATTGSGGRYGWRITAWASRRTSWAAFSTGSSGRPTRGRPACRAPAWGWRSSRRSPSCTAAPSRSAAWWNTAPPSPSTCPSARDRGQDHRRRRQGLPGRTSLIRIVS